MLSSLQDITGLIPSFFQRGGDAAGEQAVRGLGDGGRSQRSFHGADHSHGHHGRDRVSLSPQAKAAEEAAGADDDGSAGGIAETEGGSLLGQAGGFIRQALETIRNDLGKALQSFGFDSDAIQNFTQAFVEPVLSALKEGANFTAELSFAAFSQTTTLSSNGDFSQSTSLVAQSLEIEVNQDTGEVSVSLAKLSFEQDIQFTSGAGSESGQQPLLVIDPEDLVTPQELAAKILQGGSEPAEVATDAKAAAAEETAEAAAGEETAGEETAGEQSVAEAREKLAEEALEFQTRLTIYSISTYQNDEGQTVTKLLLDAQLRISTLANDAATNNAQGNDATAQEEAESLNLVA